MPKYRVSLTATIDASAGIDPTIHAVYDYDVDMHARDVTAGDIEEWGDM